MRLLGTIKKIESKPRTWEGENGTVYFFTMIFEAEGNKFIGEYAIAPSRLAPLGIRPGAVGHMDVAFGIFDVKDKETGAVLFQRQTVKFNKWSLANANQPAEAPATDAPAEQVVDLKLIQGQKVETPIAPAEQPVEGEINPETGLPF